jgi:dynein heavy chain 2
MKNNIMGKLTTHDLPLFLRLIRDSFPQAEELLGVPSRGGGKESTHSINGIEESDKVMQLQVSLEERKGCIILGPVGSGKSFLWQTLKNNFIKRGELIETFVLNPKVMEKGKLLGSLDSNTGEWKDGLLTTIIRKVTSEDLAHSKNWIICDGDIDPEWIESLNSVLDDNQLLTLPNGERFKLGDNVNFLFETRDLKFASPATISRNAIVTLECRSVSFSQHIINKWLDTEIHPDAIQIWMKQHFVPAVDFASKCESLIQLDSLALTWNCRNHVKDCKSESEFINKLSRALCVHLPSNDREKRIKEIMNCIGNSSVLNCNDHYCLGTNVSTRDFFERHGIIRIRAVENTWEILRSWTASNEHIMLIGSPGSGKSFMIQSCFTYQQGQARVHVFNCTHESKPKDIIQIVKEVCSLCSKADGMRYFPRDTNKTVLHIKYIESVSSDEYGTCSLVSFLHQLIDYHGFYDDDGTFYQLINFQLILSTKSHQVDKLMMKRFRISFVDNPTKNDLILFCDALISDSSSASQLLDENTNVHIACVVADIFELIVSLCNESECMMRLHLPFNCLKNMLENLCRYKSCGKGIGIVLALEFGYAIDDILNSIERLDLEKNKLTAAVASYLKEEKLIDSTDVMHYYSSVEKINEGQNQLVVLTEGEMKKKILSIDTSPVRRQSHLILQKTSYYFSRIEHGLITGHQNLLLIGEQGTGRKTTLRLVCSQHSIHYDTLSLTTRWDISSFQTQLKLILLQTGVEGKEVCLHLEMHQLTSPLMFVMVSEIMSICPSLIYSFFSPKERGVIYSSLEENVQSIDDHSSTTEHQFLRKINRNLHICLSINDSDLDAFITKYPSLIKKTSKVCFVPWTNHCCQKICRSIIDEMAMKREKDDNNFFVEFEPTTVEAAFIDVHKTTTNMGSTNHEFKDVVQTWANLITDKNVIMQKKFDRLRLGLRKLSETNESVYLLQEIAKETQTKVIQAQTTADEAMKAITDEMTSAQIKNNEIRKLRSELEMKSKETQLRKKDVEKELAKIQPVLKLAQEGKLIIY